MLDALASSSGRDAAAALSGPLGLWAACREAARAGDEEHLRRLARSPLFDLLDDELPAGRGAPPSARATGLLLTAQLALTPSGPAAAALAEEAAAVLGATLGAPRGKVAPRPHPGEVARDDLLADVAGAPVDVAGPASARASVLTTRHVDADVAVLAAVRRAGPPGVYVDLAASPLVRWDAEFAEALEAAWWAAGDARLSVRWSLVWESTGCPVELVAGRSVGLGAAAAFGQLTGALAAAAPGWLFTGGIDESGFAVGLLGSAGDVAVYRQKLAAAGARTVWLPSADAAAVAQLVERVRSAVELRPIGRIGELARPAAAEAPAARPECPYRGLRPFGEGDAEVFFGRERLIAHLLRELEGSGFIAVVGPSGVGKSSLVRAGLAPRLEARGGWRLTVLTPGEAPRAELAPAHGA
ncbi:MAG: ATP-binding protein, partial [Acidimicrobiales bacterium]